jgi:hypothetical protein
MQVLDWMHLLTGAPYCWYNEPNTGAFWVDGLFFGGKRYTQPPKMPRANKILGYAKVEVNEELWSDPTNALDAHSALLANLKTPAEKPHP